MGIEFSKSCHYIRNVIKDGHSFSNDHLASNSLNYEKLVDINFEELENMDDNQQEYLVDILDFLAKWLVNHILKMDKLIGA